MFYSNKILSLPKIDNECKPWPRMIQSEQSWGDECDISISSPLINVNKGTPSNDLWFFLCVNEFIMQDLFSKIAWKPNQNPRTLSVKRCVGHRCNHFLWPPCVILESNRWSHNETCFVQSEKGSEGPSVWGERANENARETAGPVLCTCWAVWQCDLLCTAAQLSSLSLSYL